jgi:hypothetical protein
MGPDSGLPGQRITLRVAAQRSENVRVAGVVVTESLPWLEIRTDPQRLSGIVGGRENSEISFDVDVGLRTLPGVYYLSLCSVVDLGLSVTSRPLQIEREF